jgi:hypothetical protein
MRRLAAFLFAVSLAASGCAYAQTPVTGYVFNNVKYGGLVTPTATVTKSGSAHAESYVGIFGLGDASVETAAKNAGITRIHHVDYECWSILGCYAKFTTTVYGDAPESGTTPPASKP